MDSPGVTIVSRAFVEEFFPFEDPIGKRIRTGRTTWREVVGVAGDVAQSSSLENRDPQIYSPVTQSPIADIVLLIKSDRPVPGLIEEAKAVVNATDANQPIHGIATMEQRVSRALSGSRSNATLMTLLGLLAAVGLSGLLSYIVSQRTREIGIRVALGARKGDVLAPILRHGLVPTGVGLALGLAVAPVLAYWLSQYVPGLGVMDPTAVVSVVVLFLVVTAVACSAPALRAARVDPMVTLRHD